MCATQAICLLYKVTGRFQQCRHTMRKFTRQIIGVKPFEVYIVDRRFELTSAFYFLIYLLSRGAESDGSFSARKKNNSKFRGKQEHQWQGQKTVNNFQYSPHASGRIHPIYLLFTGVKERASNLICWANFRCKHVRCVALLPVCKDV